MNIKYKILSANPKEHSIIIRFYTDTITEEMLSIKDDQGNVLGYKTDANINIWQVPAPTGQALQDYIMSFAPIGFFTLQEQILNPKIDTSMSSIDSLIGVEKSATITPRV